MKLLWFSWKDITNPHAGGAEDVTHNILKRFASEGNDVLLITASYKEAEDVSKIDGYRVVRVGGRWTVYVKAWLLFRRKYRDWPDVVVEECNTIPFFTNLYADKKRIAVFYQLCREIWFYQMFWPLSQIGYWLEPLYLSLLKKEKIVTISKSSKADLVKYGFHDSNIEIMRLGISIERAHASNTRRKYSEPTLLSLGAFRPMKRTLDIVKAFEIAKTDIPSLKLVMAGDNQGEYGNQVKAHLSTSPYKTDISCLGRIEEKEKMELMGKSHLIAVTSVKEGWGLIVTEAASQGTPAVGYDVDGLRDSIHNGRTGLLSKENTPAKLAQVIVELLQDEKKLMLYSRNAWESSLENTYDSAFRDFKSALNPVLQD